MEPRALHHPDYAHVPDLLRQMRMDANLTQRELADLLDVKQQTVHASETKSRRVDISEFVRWSQACGLDVHAALDRFIAGRM